MESPDEIKAHQRMERDKVGSIDFSIIKVKHEVHLILSFNLTIYNNFAATKITRRNTMHKNTRSILENPSQQGKKTQPNLLLYSSREIPSPPIRPSTQESAQTLEDLAL
jgi:hypothetical protein